MSTLTDRKIVNQINRIAGKCIGKSFGANYFSGTIVTAKVDAVLNKLVELGMEPYDDPYKVEGVKSFKYGDLRVHLRPQGRGWYTQISEMQRVSIPMD